MFGKLAPPPADLDLARADRATYGHRVRWWIETEAGIAGAERTAQLVRRLQAGGYTQVITRSRAELDLLDQRAVLSFLEQERPDYLFIAAAKVGGINANNLN